MRLPGLLEIVIIVIIIAFVLLAVRILGTPARREAKKITKYGEAEEKEENNDERIRQVRRSRAQILGIILVLAGVLVLLASLNLVKWVFWSSVGAFVIAAIGLVAIFMARGR